jgi:hypothetical protein
MATTTNTHDYMGRLLQNADPGTTDPVLDYLGREVAAGNVDYMGRALQTIA